MCPAVRLIVTQVLMVMTYLWNNAGNVVERAFDHTLCLDRWIFTRRTTQAAKRPNHVTWPKCVGTNHQLYVFLYNLKPCANTRTVQKKTTWVFSLKCYDCLKLLGLAHFLLLPISLNLPRDAYQFCRQAYWLCIRDNFFPNSFCSKKTRLTLPVCSYALHFVSSSFSVSKVRSITCPVYLFYVISFYFFYELNNNAH